MTLLTLDTYTRESIVSSVCFHADVLLCKQIMQAIGGRMRVSTNEFQCDNIGESNGDVQAVIEFSQGHCYGKYSSLVCRKGNITISGKRLFVDAPLVCRGSFDINLDSLETSGNTALMVTAGRCYANVKSLTSRISPEHATGSVLLSGGDCDINIEYLVSDAAKMYGVFVKGNGYYRLYIGYSRLPLASVVVSTKEEAKVYITAGTLKRTQPPTMPYKTVTDNYVVYISGAKVCYINIGHLITAFGHNGLTYTDAQVSHSSEGKGSSFHFMKAGPTTFGSKVNCLHAAKDTRVIGSINTTTADPDYITDILCFLGGCDVSLGRVSGSGNLIQVVSTFSESTVCFSELENFADGHNLGCFVSSGQVSLQGSYVHAHNTCGIIFEGILVGVINFLSGDKHSGPLIASRQVSCSSNNDNTVRLGSTSLEPHTINHEESKEVSYQLQATNVTGYGNLIDLSCAPDDTSFLSIGCLQQQITKHNTYSTIQVREGNNVISIVHANTDGPLLNAEGDVVCYCTCAMSLSSCVISRENRITLSGAYWTYSEQPTIDVDYNTSLFFLPSSGIYNKGEGDTLHYPGIVTNYGDVTTNKKHKTIWRNPSLVTEVDIP